MAIARVTGFPFHLPAGLQEGTNHVTTEILATNVVVRMGNGKRSGKSAAEGIY
jgi:hypothetical protein